MAKDLAELQEEVVARGFTHDFGSDTNLAEIIATDLRIVETVSLDSGTDPGDDVTMYLIEAPTENGYLILSDSLHSDPAKAAFIRSLLQRPR